MDIDLSKVQLCETTYDDMNSCNACGGDNCNDVTVRDTVEGIICEVDTRCKLCGNEDYWAYGTFESNQWLEGKAKQN